MQNVLKLFAGRDSVSFEKRFTRSLVVLTIFYSITLSVILLISTSVSYSAFSSRIRARYERIPSPPGIIIEVQRGPTANEIKQDFVNAIALVNGVLLVIAIGASYVLARLTLRPLKTAYEDQRRFIADASHELKTPLAIMSMELENENTPEAKSKLQEVKRMTKIVQDLLLLSKLENAAESPSPIISVDVVSVLKDVVKRLGVVAEAYKVNIDFKDPNEPFFVKGNEHISHIFSNIIQNGIIYNKPEGKVEVSVEKVGSEVDVIVKDTGQGMTRHDLEHIFDRFYRADKSRSRKSGGSGLGLSIAERGIESVGGRIKMQSELEKGTTVTMSFIMYS